MSERILTDMKLIINNQQNIIVKPEIKKASRSGNSTASLIEDRLYPLLFAWASFFLRKDTIKPRTTRPAIQGKKRTMMQAIGSTTITNIRINHPRRSCIDELPLVRSLSQK